MVSHPKSNKGYSSIVTALFLILVLYSSSTLATIYTDGRLIFQLITEAVEFGVEHGETVRFSYAFNNQQSNESCTTLNGGNVSLVLTLNSIVVHDFNIPCSGNIGQTLSLEIPDTFDFANNYQFNFFYQFRPNDPNNAQTHHIITTPFAIGENPVITSPTVGMVVDTLEPDITWNHVQNPESYWLILADLDSGGNTGISSCMGGAANNAVFEEQVIFENNYTIPPGIMLENTNYEVRLISRQFGGRCFSSREIFSTFNPDILFQDGFEL